MRAWESAEWFKKWLELARIELEPESHDLQSSETAADLEMMELNGAEEHKLAA